MATYDDTQPVQPRVRAIHTPASRVSQGKGHMQASYGWTASPNNRDRSPVRRKTSSWSWGTGKHTGTWFADL